ncbi:peptidoglycan DD-metalloendopeptidase family protein [Patescibacteria group bacterium]
MNDKQKKQYQWLQVLTYSLQKPEYFWPPPSSTEQQTSLEEIKKFASKLSLDLEAGNIMLLLKKVSAHCHQALTVKETKTLPIPEELEKSVNHFQKDFDKINHRAQEKALEETYESPTKGVKQLHENLSIKVEELLGKESLAYNPPLAQAVASSTSHKIVEETPLNPDAQQLSAATSRVLPQEFSQTSLGQPPSMGEVIEFGENSLELLRKIVPNKKVKQALAKIAPQAVKQSIKQAVKQTFKQIGKQLIKRLGLEGAKVALGAASAGVAYAVITAAEVVWKFLKPILKPIIDKIKLGLHKIFHSPGGIFGAILVGGAMLAFLPGPLGLIGLLPIAAGGVAAVSLGTTIIGSTLAGAVGSVLAVVFAFLSATVGAPIGLLLSSVLAIAAVVTFSVVMMTAAAFIIPVVPTQYAPPPPINNEYFWVIKTADQQTFLSAPASVNYTIQILASQSVEITSVVDDPIVNCEGETPPVLPMNIPPSEFTVGGGISWRYEYRRRFDDSFQNCRICNTVTVRANIPEQQLTGLTAISSTCVDIGNPPDNCPSGWPTPFGFIVQGPNTRDTWGSHQDDEALDIGVPVNTPVFSTHQGRVTRIWSDPGCSSQWVVRIEGQCQGEQITEFWHLNSVDQNLRVGRAVGSGTPIGRSGSCWGGPHLHYVFTQGVQMTSPYIPIIDDELEGCCNHDECLSGYTYPHCTCNGSLTICRW